MIRYLDIQRMSSEDGPGLRTTVFLKGCSLACAWCHNPESIAPAPETEWLTDRCLGCGACVASCPNRALTLDDEGVFIDRTVCTGCGACANVCPTGAMQIKGQEAAVEQLVSELVKDRAYFGTDGGVTLSGGEALLQSESIHLLRQLRAQGIGTAIDTCGLVPNYRLLQGLRHADYVLYDVKLLDSERHKRFTGHGNELILSNLRLVSEWAQTPGGGKLWVRTPIIPDATDSWENIDAIGRLLAALGGVERWELLAFNNLCRDKYRRLYRDWPYENTPLMKRSRMESLLSVAKATNASPLIRYTGALQQED